MIDSNSLAPRFIIFKYIIQWYIENFGIALYISIFVGIIACFLIYTLIINIRHKEFERVIMIIIFSIIIIGGLIGIGLDFYNGYVKMP
jgi:hypothetical protein